MTGPRPVLTSSAPHRPVAVAVPFADVSADGLRWALGLDPREALTTRTVALPGPLRAELRILGASHQLIVRAEDEMVFSETVACDLPGSSRLPALADEAGYRVAGRVSTHPAADFHDRVTELEATLAQTSAADRTLAWARFPGAPDAMTAISFTVAPGLARWETWHTYPNTSEVVHTSSTLDLERVMAR